jgi:hypothetical protein
MLAHCCGVLVAPDSEANVSRWCDCKQCAVWWANPLLGHLACYGPTAKHISMIGINNDFLTSPYKKLNEGKDEYGCITKDEIDSMIDRCPHTYLFKTVESNIIRFRPDFHGIVGVTFTSDLKTVPEEAK